MNLPLLAAAALSGLTFTVSAASIWVEGEAPAKSSAQKHGWYDGVNRDVLSGANWLSHYGPAPAEASYEVDVAEAGSHTGSRTPPKAATT